MPHPCFRVLTLPVSSSLQKMMLSFHEEEEGLPDSFLSNFPSLIKVDIHAKVSDPSVAKSMMGCVLSSLKANGESQQCIDYNKFHYFFSLKVSYNLCFNLIFNLFFLFLFCHPQGRSGLSAKSARLIRECWTSTVSWDALKWPKWRVFPKTSSSWVAVYEEMPCCSDTRRAAMGLKPV